jgi:hypothetical protein
MKGLVDFAVLQNRFYYARITHQPIFIAVSGFNYASVPPFRWRRVRRNAILSYLKVTVFRKISDMQWKFITVISVEREVS